MRFLSRTGVSGLVVTSCALLCGFASSAAAQAFIPEPGQAVVCVSYQSVRTHGQHGVTGKWFSNAAQVDRLGEDETASHAVIWYVEYGLAKRIAVHASLPYVQGRYDGPIRHTEGFDGRPSNLDDGTYHGRESR